MGKDLTHIPIVAVGDDGETEVKVVRSFYPYHLALAYLRDIITRREFFIGCSVWMQVEIPDHIKEEL